MNLTYILVDFENVQPQDLDLLADQQFRVKVFHGSHQNKLDMTLVKALQPLGAHVEYVQSETPGKNALDFHVAFCMGRLLEAHRSNGIPARFGIISRDGGFEPLLRHVRSLGYAAKQAGSVREVLDFADDKAALSPPTEPPAIGTASGVLHGRAPAAVVRTQATTTAAPTEQAPAKKGAAIAGSVQPKSPSSDKKGVAEDIDKVIEHLRKHAKNRPTKRVALERHIPSLLGGQVRSPATVQAVMAGLEKQGIVEFSDKAIKYKIPAA
ncbi:MAG: hypothetical protein JNK06_05625 [Candidatus Accumulibacter phosphatis]|uniref:PIN domain-containing protein n=1 Tax=Candidatus Accumulibacter phosphatis TaxID=327160 RepID=UPI001A4309DB|nr:hypothetical protein [Candidatus Accumulibacter phosphatis]